jgi:hypothetical protein
VASDGKYILWGGNANMNGIVNFIGIQNDKDFVYNATLNSLPGAPLLNVYAPSDMNMDGNVRFNGIGNDKDFLYNSILKSTPSETKIQSLP